MSAADRIEVRRGVLRSSYGHSLYADGEFLACINDLQADLFDEVLAAARQAPAPLPEGMGHTVMASGADILRHEWQWRFSSHDEWRAAYCASSGGPFPDSRYECRPPHAEPQMVAVMLPADVVQRFSDPAADLRLTGIDEAAVIDACRAALTEGGES